LASSNGQGTPLNGAPLIRAEGIWKIFGKNADKVLGTADLDLSRAELREKTGCVAAVRDVSFDVYPGQVFGLDRRPTPTSRRRHSRSTSAAR